MLFGWLEDKAQVKVSVKCGMVATLAMNVKSTPIV